MVSMGRNWVKKNEAIFFLLKARPLKVESWDKWFDQQNVGRFTCYTFFQELSPRLGIVLKFFQHLWYPVMVLHACPADSAKVMKARVLIIFCNKMITVY